MAAAAIAVVSGACSSGGDDTATRQVRVDHSSDEYPSFVLQNFPEKVSVHRGDTVEFKQTWTGEPHTVTGGTSVSDKVRSGAAWIDFFDAFETMASSGVELPNPEDPGDATFGDFSKAFQGAKDAELREKGTSAYATLVAQDIGLPALDASSTRPFGEIVKIVEDESEKYFSTLGSAFGDDDQLAQNISQPCYLDTGEPPEDQDTPCEDGDQDQPEFDGRQSFYNSGVLPYEGEQGNKFTVKVADDAELGSYLFYCAIHGPQQRSEIEIVEHDAEIPSQSDVNRLIRSQTEEVTAPLDEIQADAEKDLRITPAGAEDEIEGPFAGLPGRGYSGINEFLPKEISVKVGKPITWKMMGADHSISFDVPKYFPIVEFLKDGTVRINPKMDETAGGAIAYEPPEDEEADDPARGEDGIVRHDGGTYDGTGFWSSGLIGAQPYLEYTMKITKPGTYAYACLLHPAMVGRIKVTA
jgi:plastocyanin